MKEQHLISSSPVLWFVSSCMSYLTKLPHMSTKCHLPQRTRIHFFFFFFGHNSWWNSDGILIITRSYVQKNIFVWQSVDSWGDVWRHIAERPDSRAAESCVCKQWRVSLQTKVTIMPAEDPFFGRPQTQHREIQEFWNLGRHHDFFLPLEPFRCLSSPLRQSDWLE